MQNITTIAVLKKMGRLTTEQRIAAVLRKEQGESYLQIARRFSTSKQAIIDLIRKHRTTGSVKDQVENVLRLFVRIDNLCEPV